LRRAMGFKRSTARMQQIETRLREGMAHKGIRGATADRIVRSITSFALYGFPESHAASFALIAYASAYLKCHHPAAFYAAMLNCYPLGFYHPATLVKDAQHHQVTVLPIDVTQSDWACTIVGVARKSSGSDTTAPPALDYQLRLGLKYVTGMRAETGQRIERARAHAPFKSIADFTARVAPNRRELEMLAWAGAFAQFHPTRRDALWQATAVERDPASLLAGVEPASFPAGNGSSSSPAGAESGSISADGGSASSRDAEFALSPDESYSGLQLPRMTPIEETFADFASTGLTAGPHVIAHVRARLGAAGVLSAADLADADNGAWVRVAGVVIVRQRPGTAKGFLFLTLEDETGIANAIVTPDIFQAHRTLLHRATVLIVEGPLQKQQGVIHVRGRKFRELKLAGAVTRSHDFH
ncbi:MAG TPA: OB-fold nucleic acid binding domain-containing protein, partial [Candidatus Binataceae bacterium]|nr:OB-fold nucleic acid binding domain-containing protein [Candidatus Binataceae bacterium]